MGNHSRIIGYVSELIGKPKLKVDNRAKKFLIELLEGEKSSYKMTRIVNTRFKFRLPVSEDSSNNNNNNNNSNTSQDTNASSNATLVFSSGPISDTAVLKRMRKLAENGLIEIIDYGKMKKKTREKALLDNLHRANLFKVTEYGLFCMLSELLEYEPTSLFWRYWQTKVMRVLLSSYFEKKSVRRIKPTLYSTIAGFLIEACSITSRSLGKIENARREKDEEEYQEQIRILEDDLLWHAKSFALRLLADSTSRNKARRLKSRAILSELAHDKKFVKLVDMAVSEIHSPYRRVGGRGKQIARTE
jgi:hypothetical protein